jgi:hypothetical protein
MNKYLIVLFLTCLTLFTYSQTLGEIQGDLVVFKKAGIGTPFPQAQLHVNNIDPSLNNGVVGVFQRTFAGDVGISFSQEFVTAFGIIHPLGGGLGFYDNRYPGTDGDLRMRIRADGNVGIGNINPVRTLHVGGRVRIDNVPTGSGTVLLVNANGDVVKSSNLNVTENNLTQKAYLEKELVKRDEQITALINKINHLEQMVNKLIRQ